MRDNCKIQAMLFEDKNTLQTFYTCCLLDFQAKSDQKVVERGEAACKTAAEVWQ